MRRFAGIDLGREPVPDETTVCRFRHLLEAHDLGQRSCLTRYSGIWRRRD
jgi:IS5 family transposase